MHTDEFRFLHKILMQYEGYGDASGLGECSSVVPTTDVREGDSLRFPSGCAFSTLELSMTPALLPSPCSSTYKYMSQT